MHLKQSHGRLAGIMVIIGIPVLLGVVGGGLIFERFHLGEKKQEDQKFLKQISSQAQLLRDSILSDLKLIQSEVSIQAATRRIEPASTSAELGKVLFWSEWSIAGDRPQRLLNYARNPKWNSSVSLQNYLNSPPDISFARLSKDRMKVVRVKKDTQTSGDWLSVIFLSPYQPKTFLVALIDPQQSFSGIQNWASHSSQGKTRSYLIAEDGKVLAHSQKNWLLGHFGELSLFKNAIQKVAQGTWLSGFGMDVGIDHLPLGAAYFRVGSLPFAVVVEELVSTAPVGGQLYEVFEFGLFGLGFLLAVMWVCSWFLSRYLVKVVTLHIREQPVQDQMPLRAHEFPVRGGLFSSSKSRPGRFFSGKEFLILDPQAQLEADFLRANMNPSIPSAGESHDLSGEPNGENSS